MISAPLTASWADCHSRQLRGRGGGQRGGGRQNVTISQKVVMKKTSGRLLGWSVLPSPIQHHLHRYVYSDGRQPRAPPQSPNPPQHPPKSHPHHPSIFIPLLLRLIDFLFSPPSPSPPPPSSIFSSAFPAAQHVSLRSPSLPRPGQSFSSLTRSEPRPRLEPLKLRKWRRNVIEAAR